MILYPLFEITIPVLNEEKKLKMNVLKVSDFILREMPEASNWKIVVADNGSTDRTRLIGESLANEFDWIKYIRLDDRGVGRALKASWGQSQAEVVGYMDLDLATDLKHLKESFTALSSGYDMVYGSRLNRNSVVKGRSIKREITSRVFNFIAKHYLNVHFSDGMCGFKFIKRSIFSSLMAGGAQSNDWFFSTELLTVAEWLEYNIFELPVCWTDSTESKVRIIPLSLQYLKSMIKLKSFKSLPASPPTITY